jgi:cytochrome c oxidase subunit 4
MTRSCLLALAALLGLAALSYECSRHHLGAWAAPLALAIATVKALAIALVFIGLGRQPGSNRLALATAAVLVATMVGFVIADVAAR